VDAFAPTHVLFVDWTGALLARALFSPTPSSASDATPVGASPAMVYFNFRVFSANQIVAVSGNKGNHRCSGDSSSSKNLDKGSCNAVAESDVQFYQRMETAAMAIAHAAVALCPHDAAILDRLHLASLGQSTGISQAHDGRNSVGSSMQTSPSLLSSLRTSPPSPCLVLNPPLREDLRILARQARPSAASAGSISHTPSPTRQWLLCIARLSPEKTVEHFVRAVESAGGQNLAGLGVTPRLVGSGPNATYTAVLRKRLLKACPNAVGFPLHFLAHRFLANPLVDYFSSDSVPLHAFFFSLSLFFRLYPSFCYVSLETLTLFRNLSSCAIDSLVTGHQ